MKNLGSAQTLLIRIGQARRFLHNTTPASRHAEDIAEALLTGEPYPMLWEEREHCGESIAACIAELYELKNQIEHAKKPKRKSR